MKIGTAKLESSKKIFKLEDGDNVYRILPPLGNLADKGKFFQFYAIEWGYTDTKGNKVPFQDCSVSNYQTGMIEVESAARVKRMEMESKLAQAVELFKAKKITKQELEKVGLEKRKFSLDKKYYFNAVDLNGEIGLLKLGYKAKEQIMQIHKKYKKEQGVDIVGMKGLFFNISKTGKNRETQYVVTPYQENVKASVNGKEVVVKQEKFHTIDDNFINRLDGAAWELDSIYPAPTPEEVERIVNEGPQAVDQILGAKNRQSKGEDESVEVTQTVSKTEEVVDEVTGEITEEVAELVEQVSQTSLSTEDDDYLAEMGF